MKCVEHSHVKGTIIVVAVYINNDLNSYNQLIKCLTQLRNVYVENTIVAIDNGSLNDAWHDVANTLNVIVMHNNSLLHRFEMGAYKLALQHYRADKYIFIQGTIFINYEIDLSSLDTNQEMAVCFDTFNLFAWSQEGVCLFNKLLAMTNLNIDDWNDYPLVLLWNCFCCNDIFINNMLNSGIFDLPCNTKAHSCAFERILGSYFKKTLNDVKCIERNSFIKIFLNQDPIIFFP